MSVPHLTLSCESYKNNIFGGFSRLQEQQEFVDITLAADGHLVKVHKNIIALASPYLKEIIHSTPSQHPVIFFHNVSHKMLCYLLEYIYQGEVSVPENSIESFLQVSQALHIIGVSKAIQPKDTQSEETSEKLPEVQNTVITLDPPCEEMPSNFAAHIKISSDRNFEVQQFSQDVQFPNVLDDNQQVAITTRPEVSNAKTLQNNMPVIENFDNNAEYTETNNMEIDNSLSQNQHLTECGDLGPSIQKSSNTVPSKIVSAIDISQPIRLDKEAADALKIISQYSVTERGSVQIIVNRYIYCSHHNSQRGRKHRWRCTDYRKLHCPAYIDSLDGVIVLRKGIHNHTFHDNKIYKKHKQGLIFHSVEHAKRAKDLPKTTLAESEDIESSIEFSVIPQNSAS